MLFVVGLGNPGKQYQYTRHNIAWMILDTLVPESWSYHKYLNADIYLSESIFYIKPRTFMNLSGDTLEYLKQQPNFSLDKLVVIHDDIDLLFGNIRISYDRGDGGHNGLKSINKVIGSKQYMRIRIGVSLRDINGRVRKPNVLGNFSEQERSLVIEDISHRVHTILDSVVSVGKEATMNLYNQK